MSSVARHAQLSGNLLRLRVDANADVEDVRRAVDATLDRYAKGAEQRAQEAAATTDEESIREAKATERAGEMQQRFRS